MTQEEKKLPSELKEAAEEYNKQVIEETKCHHNALTYAEGYEDALLLIPEAFIAGAEYQRKQDQQLIELAEDHAILAGMNKMKEEMMEKAVSGRYIKADGKVYVESWPLDIDPDSIKAGDEVKIIVIPEENLNTTQNEN